MFPLRTPTVLNPRPVWLHVKPTAVFSRQHAESARFTVLIVLTKEARLETSFYFELTTGWQAFKTHNVHPFTFTKKSKACFTKHRKALCTDHARPSVTKHQWLTYSQDFYEIRCTGSLHTAVEKGWVPLQFINFIPTFMFHGRLTRYSVSS